MSFSSPFASGNISNGFPQADCSYEPGTTVPFSGIYERCHNNQPRDFVLLLQDDVFRNCPSCGSAVRYKLVRAAPHISEDTDFENVSV
jgi:hypothetical protein